MCKYYQISILETFIRSRLQYSNAQYIIYAKFILSIILFHDPCALFSNNFVFVLGCGIVCATIYLALAGV